MSSNADDPARLAARYAEMRDDELQRVAGDAASHAEAAQRALASELSRRHLAAPLSKTDPGDDRFDEIDAAGSVPVTLRRFRDLPEAFFAKGSLESAGIERHLVDENMVRMDWFISNLLGGVKLQVRPEDVAEATEILKSAHSRNLEGGRKRSVPAAALPELQLAGCHL